MDFRKFASRGMVLLGMTETYDNGVITAGDLKQTLLMEM